MGCFLGKRNPAAPLGDGAFDLYGKGLNTMVKNAPLAVPAPAPVAADADPLLLAARPIAKLALLPDVVEVVFEAVAPVVPPGVVC